MSTSGKANVPETPSGSLSVEDQDLLLGEGASPTSWTLLLEGSTLDVKKITGVSGTVEDLFVTDDDEVILRRTGASGPFEVYWDGREYGFDKKLDAIHVMIG